jgi:pantothenate kinase
MRVQALTATGQTPVVNLDAAAEMVVERWEVARRRIIVGIGGFPASGKTTAADVLVRLILKSRRDALAVHLPMDGFHFPNEVLEARGLEEIKGALSTYDRKAFEATLAAYKRSAGVPLLAPDYVRARHEISENAIVISSHVGILVTEGIYVGYAADEWRRIRELLDFLFYLDASPEICAERIVARNMDAGRTDSVIERKLRNDFDFMERSITILQQAEYILRCSA